MVPLFPITIIFLELIVPSISPSTCKRQSKVKSPFIVAPVAMTVVSEFVGFPCLLLSLLKIAMLYVSPF